MYHFRPSVRTNPTPAPRRRRAAKTAAVSAGLAGVLVASVLIGTQHANAAVLDGFGIETLNGAGNNVAHPTWGQTNTPYSRVAPARFADGRSQMVAAPNSRAISNRIFNDSAQNIFSEGRITQWGWTWGQFLDHTFGLAEGGGRAANIAFSTTDPLESFRNDLGTIGFTRDAAAPGTGTTNPRQAINTVNSYIDASAVYGPTNDRLEWLRDGPLDGNLSNNGPTLMMPNNFLPRATARGNASTAPAMAIDGRLAANPANRMVAGDVRANENIALTATQTLFAREHNRIVGLLPASLSSEEKFQIARRVVIAEQQYITYNEFLPSMGVSIPAYTGYKSNVNTTLSNEFATVGYRAHSQIHGEFGVAFQPGHYTNAQLDRMRAMGIEVVLDGADSELVIPLGVAFFNPDIVPLVGEAEILGALSESQYNNDEMIDNQLRSTLFQIPVAGNQSCLDGPTLPECFTGVSDLAAIDIERGRDHGMPSYNQMRQAYGLAPKTSFAAITGESTDAFPRDPQLTPGNENNDPNSVDFMSTKDIAGNPIALGEANGATSGVKRTTTAARLRATYGGNINAVDAFVGMSAEKHLAGSEFGELQHAIWARQFAALRDGDRFFYGNDPALSVIKSQLGIDFRTTLAQVVSRDAGIPQADLNDNLFLVPDDDLPAASCSVDYTITSSWNHQFQTNFKITNTGTQPLSSWTVGFHFANGQQIGGNRWNGTFTQSGNTVSVRNASWNGTLAPGASLDGVGFIGSWDNAANGLPPNLTLNGQRCARE
jgi:hypothetical protein